MLIGLIARCAEGAVQNNTDAANTSAATTMTIFQKIIRREIPAKIIWEDDDAIAFHDINPQAPVHVLVVPKKIILRLGEATEADGALLGKLLRVAAELATKLDIDKSGYRVVINSGPDAGESVPHFHVHLLGKRALAW